jgi:hypothetical protein
VSLPPVYTERLIFQPHVSGDTYSDPVADGVSWVLTCLNVYYGGILEVQVTVALQTLDQDCAFYSADLTLVPNNRSSQWNGRLKLYSGERFHINVTNPGATTEFVDVSATGFILQGE